MQVLVIPISQSVATKQGASLTLLLSNGTLLTLQENSVMKVGTFKQEPFDAKGKKKLLTLMANLPRPIL